MCRRSLLIVVILFLIDSCSAQQAMTTVNLAGLVAGKKITTFNRAATILNDAQNKNAIHLDAKEGYGVVWLNDILFADGSIELDIRGRNLMQQSFVGIAFHGLNDSTMDAVYFRPFNFQSSDPERKGHSVQYISLPSYDWPRLRTSFPNKYEFAVNPAPQPDAWFNVRIEIKGPRIDVYVNGNSNASLTVEKLNGRQQGMLGLWVGNNSEGDFANLKITAAQ